PPAGSITMPEIPKPEPHQGFKPGDIIGRTSEGRAVVINDEGGISTERIITLEDPRQKGAWINIPSMYEGKVVSDPEALAIIVRAGFTDPETGRPIESFPSIEAAEEAAQLRTK